MDAMTGFYALRTPVVTLRRRNPLAPRRGVRSVARPRASEILAEWEQV